MGRTRTHSTQLLLIAAHAEAPDYLMLEEALKSDVGPITEISEGGSVPVLAFENNATARVRLVDGEDLIGARQNRILNKVVGAELFDSPETLGRFFQKLLRSIALDAIDVEQPVTSVPAAAIARA